MVELALGLGLVVSLVFSELFGLASAGLVVPGYLALYLDRPLRLLATLGIALLTWAIVRYAWARLVVLYGRRRFAVTVLTGFILNAALTQAAFLIPGESLELRAVGYIVPGLIANTALTQGPVTTFGITVVVAVVVRAILMVVVRV